MYLQENAQSLGDRPYWVFVSFLYAWVAADIADRFTKASSHRLEHKDKNLEWYAPVWSHLTLAAFVVATSWLGWSHSFAGQKISESVVSLSSVRLIVDFWILGTYFGLVRLVNDARTSDNYKTEELPYSTQVAWWVAWIFLAYLVWDFLTYVVLAQELNNQDHFWRRSWMSALCWLLAIAFFLALRRVQGDRRSAFLAADIALIGLVLFYRALKMAGENKQAVSIQLANLACPLGSWLNEFTWLCFLIFIAAGCGAVFLGRTRGHRSNTGEHGLR